MNKRRRERGWLLKAGSLSMWQVERNQDFPLNSISYLLMGK